MLYYCGVSKRLNAGRLLSRSLFLSITMFSLISVVRADPIDDLPVGHWYQVPNSALFHAAPLSVPRGIQGPTSVIGQASGGALDSKRELLLVWGGGHAAYSGNEVYAFDLKTIKWSRLVEPSTDVGGYEKSGYYPDGKPRSRHTYDYVEYIPPPVDRFCCFGASGIYPSGQGVIGNVDCLDPESRRWERRANAISYGVGAMAAYDPATGKVWMHGAGSRGFLTSFDPKQNRWEANARPGVERGAISVEPTAEIDPERRKFVAVGSGRVIVWDLLESWPIQGKDLTTSGDAAIVQSKSPGFVYDPVLKKFVAWSGGGDVYILDIDRAVWKRQSPDPGNKVTPGPAASRGTFGRFRYVPSRNVYIVVSDIYEAVFIYRLTAGSGVKR